MDVFSEVGAVTQQAESCIRKREEAKSVLVRAMLEGETQCCREGGGKGDFPSGILDHPRVWVFPGVGEIRSVDIEAASEAARNLAFLEKWRRGSPRLLREAGLADRDRLGRDDGGLGRLGSGVSVRENSEVLLIYQRNAPPPMTATKVKKTIRMPRHDFMADFYGG